MRIYLSLVITFLLISHCYSQNEIVSRKNCIIVRVVEYELDVRKSQYLFFDSNDNWIKSKKGRKRIFYKLDVDSLFDLQLEKHDIRYDILKMESFYSFEKTFNEQKFLHTDYKAASIKNGNANIYIEFFCAPLTIKYSKLDPVKERSDMIWEDNRSKLKICWNYKVYIDEISLD